MCATTSNASVCGDVQKCSRLSDWSKLAVPPVPHGPSTAEAAVARLLQLVDCGERVLLWLDAADIDSVRAVVAFAQHANVVIHVGSSAGAAIAKRVMLNDGWLGSSLAEVATHADLVITLGDRIFSNSPLLPSRFFARQLSGGLRWWHIVDPAARQPQTDDRPADESLLWPQGQWYARLTHVQQLLQSEDQAISVTEADGNPSEIHVDERRLARALSASQNTVWMWDNSQFSCPLDELLVRRLLMIARLRSQHARCGLLHLETHLGQLSAEECLLWLTGCTGTAYWNGQNWQSPAQSPWNSLHDWRQEYAQIVVLRSMPAWHALPELQADLWLLPEQFPGDSPPAAEVIRVATAGVNYPTHFLRGDRGAMLRVGCQTASTWPTAPEIFSQAVCALQQRKGASDVA